MIEQSLLILSCGILGIFLGAQIAEAVLFVPYWKALSADDFFELHQTYGKKIHRFFAPLTISATLLPVLTGGYQLLQGTGRPLLTWIMVICTLAFFSTYFIYFKKANQSFGDRSLSNEALPQELVRWGNWHWTRVVFEVVAFVCSLLLLAF